MVWLKYLACLVIILFAGTRLARYGNALGEKTGLGGLWIGLVLVAAITSIPELVTGVSSAALVGLPDLAMGTLLGSCLFNLTILALLDILHPRVPVLSEVKLRHIASAGVGILLIAVAAVSIFAGERLSGVRLGWVGIPSIIILILYSVAMWRMLRFERKQAAQRLEATPSQYEGMPARTMWFKFALAAIAVIGAGIWLSFIGDEIAGTYGWSASFVGSLFLAISSSMPELVVSIAALRLGALDMAVADILGSNMFNIAIIFLVDLFYAQGPILSQPRSLMSSAHLSTAVVVVVMSLLVIAGLRFHQKRKTFTVISWYGPLLIGLYIFGAYMLYSQV